jgi:hypothetical protein
MTAATRGSRARFLEQRVVDPATLTPYPGNPNIGDVEAVRASLRANGQYRTPVTRPLPDGGLQVLAGHTTRLAAIAEHMPLRVDVVDADDKTARRIVLADNRTAQLSRYDEDLLLAILDGGDMEGTGWDQTAYEELLDGQGSENPYDYSDGGTAAEDEPPQVPGAQGVYADDAVIAAAFEHFRRAGFPYPVVPKYAAMQQINRLARTVDEALLNTTAAYHVADPYQPHRFETPIPGTRTPLQVFGLDEPFQHALRLALETGQITPSSLMGTLAFARNAQLAAQFRPGFALAMYRRFAPPGGTVLDTSTGFGGRLTGFLASRCSEYIGIDPNTATLDGNRRLADDLCPPDKRVELHCLPAEDVPRDVVAGRCDFAFTSPPYFGKEMYSDEDTQSWKRYPAGEGWRKGFLVPMLALQHAALRSGSFSVVNIADVTIKRESYPLLQWTIDAAAEVGFKHERTERFPIGRVPGRGEAAEGFEPVVILRKR